MEGRVAIATLDRPRGIRGEMAATSLSSYKKRFDSLSRVFAGATELTIERIWWHGDRLIFKFAGIDSIDDAMKLAGSVVEVPFEERFSPDEGEYFLADLVGCEIVDAGTGEPYGRVTGWQELPGQTLLEVSAGFEIPFTRAIFVEIDIARRRLVAMLPEGLRDLNQRPERGGE